MDFGLPILRGPIDLHLVYSFHDLPRPLGHIRTRRQPLACTLDRKVQKPDSSPLYYYVAAILDPHIKTSFIKVQMSESDADLIISQVQEFLKKQYPFEA